MSKVLDEQFEAIRAHLGEAETEVAAALAIGKDIAATLSGNRAASPEIKAIYADMYMSLNAAHVRIADVRAALALTESVGLARAAVETPPSSPDDGTHAAAVALGRRGGIKGGAARAKALSNERRSEIASAAAKARWKSRP